MTGARAFALLLALICAVACGVWAMPDSHGRERQASGGGRRIEAGPDNYLGRLRRLKAGDTLVLAPGSYDSPDDVPGLPIFDLHGKPGRPITITGDPAKPRPVLIGRSTHNTIRLRDASYIAVRHLEIDGQDQGGDGVNAQGVTHHITIEDLVIHGVGNDQQTVGISTKAPAWNWVIRRCAIVGAGTGMYLGRPDGTAPFVAGLIENNLIQDTIGYNLQVKHQQERPQASGMPGDAAMTIVRHNVFAKTMAIGAPADERPNVLFGHFPRRGAGSEDRYVVYGNFFYENASGECLLQGEGNLVIHNNVFVNSSGSAVCVHPHNDVPRDVRILFNTIVARDAGIVVRGADKSGVQYVAGNAVFAAMPVRAPAEEGNIVDAVEAAPDYLTRPFAVPGDLDLSGKPGRLAGPVIVTGDAASWPGIMGDFEGRPRDNRLRGAYGTRDSPKWPLSLSIKPLPDSLGR